MQRDLLAALTLWLSLSHSTLTHICHLSTHHESLRASLSITLKPITKKMISPGK
jgi:hypothetical protein